MKKLAVLLVLLVLAAAATKLLPAFAQGGGFSNASLSGTYVFHVTGNGGTALDVSVLAETGSSGLPPVPILTPFSYGFPVATPFFSAGRFVVDGNGNITSGTGVCFHEIAQTAAPASLINPNPSGPTYQAQGVAGSITNITGTYTVNSDGTGSMTLEVTSSCPNSDGVTSSGPVSVPFSFILASKGKVGVLWSFSGATSGTLARQ
jgi:hypothetical protein